MELFSTVLKLLEMPYLFELGRPRCEADDRYLAKELWTYLQAGVWKSIGREREEELHRGVGMLGPSNPLLFGEE